MHKSKILGWLSLLLTMLLFISACGGQTATEAPTSSSSATAPATSTESGAATTAPAATTESGAATTAPAATTESGAATTAPAAPVASSAATSAPSASGTGMTSEQVDAIDLTGKSVTVTYWHNRS